MTDDELPTFNPGDRVSWTRINSERRTGTVARDDDTDGYYVMVTIDPNASIVPTTAKVPRYLLELVDEPSPLIAAYHAIADVVAGLPEYATARPAGEMVLEGLADMMTHLNVEIPDRRDGDGR